jgi:hypothetical protein
MRYYINSIKIYINYAADSALQQLCNLELGLVIVDFECQHYYYGEPK